jgi:Flp pilus assembly protein TadG
MGRLQRLYRIERGSALVEASIALPLLLVLIGGVFEFGFFFYQQQLISTGIRDAARYLALSADPTSAFNQNEARNLAVTGAIAGGIARLPGWTVDDVSVTITPWDNSDGALSGAATIPIVTVSTSIVDRSLGFLNLIGLKAPTINVAHQERWVGGSSSRGVIQ